jgi:Heavy metal associated domain 2
VARPAEETLYLEHMVQGRARLRVPRPRTPAQVRRTASRIGRIDRVRNVQANPTTGSLLITFNPDDPLDLLIADLRAVGIAVEAAFHAIRPLQTQSKGAVAVRHMMGGANAKLHQLTRGNLDLKLVVPAVYLALAVRNFAGNRARLRDASWYQLLYWAFDSFFKLHEESTVRDASRTDGRIVH